MDNDDTAKPKLSHFTCNATLSLLSIAVVPANSPGGRRLAGTPTRYLEERGLDPTPLAFL